MKTTQILVENIWAMMQARHLRQVDVAKWCGHQSPWISAILLGERGISFEDLDKIADLFGIPTYMLFLPGVAKSSERRSGHDRRIAVKDRRISMTERVRLHVIGGPSELSAPQHEPSAAPDDAAAAQVERILEDAIRKVSRIRLAPAGHGATQRAVAATPAARQSARPGHRRKTARPPKSRLS